MYLINFWTNMFNFKGNIGIFEYWIPVVFFNFGLYALGFFSEYLLNTVGYVYCFGYLIACVSSGVRRLHDINFSGFWLILTILPVLNIFLFVMLLMPSEVANVIVDVGATKPKDITN